MEEPICKYAPFILVSYYLAALINDNKYVETSIIVTILTLASYIIHRGLHSMHIPAITSIHMRHHQSNHLHKLIDDLSETFLNFFVIGSGALLLLPLSEAHSKLLLYFSLLYTSIHMVNYSFLKTNQTHINHHQNPRHQLWPRFSRLHFQHKRRYTARKHDAILHQRCGNISFHKLYNFLKKNS